MKILWITGDDYSALIFEEQCTIQETAEQLKVGESKEFEGADYIFSAKLLEFKDVDPKFIEFVQNEVMDYDGKKHANFYVVEPTNEGENDEN